MSNVVIAGLLEQAEGIARLLWGSAFWVADSLTQSASDGMQLPDYGLNPRQQVG